VSRDLCGVLLSAAWVAAVILVAELARRRGLARQVTRKIVHVGIGSWIVPSYLLFSTWRWPAALALGFTAVNALSHRFGWIASMEGEEHSVGTVLYPLSVALLLATCWEPGWRAVGAAGVLVMAYGDAAASLVGRRFGRRTYRVAGHPRTLEGSVAMAAVGWLSILLAFALLGRVPEGGLASSALSGGLLLAAAAAALVATLAEAVSLYGVDNLLVPVATALTLAALRGRLWA
jgi:dolichol kinase